MTASPSLAVLCERCGQEHPDCVVCSPTNPVGMQLHPDLRADGSVAAVFPCAAVFQGYPGILHGGITASLLDGIMTHCLFAHDVSAVTAELTIRFRHPIAIGTPVTVRAWRKRSHSMLHLVAAELVQNDQVKTTASAKFLERKS
ncbi:MAG: hypothetical protein PCFJNLEI_00357 [Verrucomicrobiae bacterium]|nr:hypothetical protein [Verrucomicrobiae bacterium]